MSIVKRYVDPRSPVASIDLDSTVEELMDAFTDGAGNTECEVPAALKEVPVRELTDTDLEASVLLRDAVLWLAGHGDPEKLSEQEIA